MGCDNNFSSRLPQRSAHARRLHVPSLHVGAIALEDAQAHHARDVLRLPDGSPVEVFDDAGNTAAGTLGFPDDRQAVVTIESIQPPRPADMTWSIASAVPKAERADWLVEKLSELGTARWIPLATARSVALPTGTGKRQRWLRIATESAKQSRRPGVMAIDELTPLATAIGAVAPPRSAEMIGSPERSSGTCSAWVLSPADDAVPISKAVEAGRPAELTLFIGPEGGWTEGELSQFAAAGIVAVRLGRTVLRVETAAVAGAAVVAAAWA